MYKIILKLLVLFTSLAFIHSCNDSIPEVDPADKIKIRDGYADKFVPDTAHLNADLLSLKGKEKRKLIKSLSPESQEFIEYAELSKDSMSHFLKEAVKEISAEEVKIYQLTFYEKNFHEIKKRFEERQRSLLKENEDEYKIIYSILSTEMDQAIRKDFMALKSEIKNKKLGTLASRLPILQQK